MDFVLLLMVLLFFSVIWGISVIISNQKEMILALKELLERTNKRGNEDDQDAQR